MTSIIKNLGVITLLLAMFAAPDAVHAFDTTQTSNAAPVFTSTPETDAETGTMYFYWATATDDNDVMLTYSLESGPTGMAFNDTGFAGYAIWTPDDRQVGDHDIVIRATDSEGLYAEQSFTVTVTGAEVPDTTAPANEAPVFASNPAPTTDAEAGELYYSNSYATDDNDAVLTYSLESSPAGMTLTDTASYYYLLWTPGSDQAGDHDVVVRATDSEGLYAEQSFTVTVTVADVPDTTTPANEAPVFTSKPGTDAETGSMYFYWATATDDNDAILTYSLAFGPTGMALTDTGFASYVIWTPADNQAGYHVYGIKATDSEGLSTTQVCTLAVSDAGDTSSYTGAVETSGGTVTDPASGTTVDIPAGAVVEAIVVEIVPAASDPADSAVNTVVEFNVVGNPDGYTFENPVAITIGYDAGSVTDPANLRIAYYNEDTGEWEVIDASTVDTDAQTVTAYVSHFSTYGVVETNDSGALLPVELEGLTATAGTDGITLAWQTVSETNCLGFNVERSATADGPFERINAALIRGAGNSTDVNDYAWTDTGAAAGIWFYRLVVMDTDGSTEYSEIVSAEMQTSGIAIGTAAGTNALRSCTILRMDGTLVPAGSSLKPGMYLYKEGTALKKVFIGR